MLKLSIIIPVYNAEKTIERCINSILNQEFKDFEIILINDGSTDRSGEICSTYVNKDSRIKLYSQSNGGVSSARNVGLREAKGEFITFIDADDYIEEECYKKLEDKLKGTDLIFYHYIYENEKNGDRTKIYNKNLKNLRDNTKNFKMLYTSGKGEHRDGVFIDESISIFIWRIWFRREFLLKNNIKFNEKLRLSEDRIFLQQILLKEPKIEISDDNFGYIHTISKNGTSLTDKKDLKFYIPWLYEQAKNMDIAEQEVCNLNPELNKNFIKELRLRRAMGMRSSVIVNEFKNNKENARLNIEKYRKDDFFKWAYNIQNFIFTLKNGDKKDILRFLLVKFRGYFILEKIYAR